MSGIEDLKPMRSVYTLTLTSNPWGVKEWNGAWSDGSEQWTPEWMELLGHKFGNDGVRCLTFTSLGKHS